MPILEFKDVHKVLKSGFTRRPVYTLGPLSLDVEAGEIFGCLGPNGAGKTTSIKLAMGILRPDSGEIRFFGESARRTHVKGRIGFLPEHPYFYPHLTAFELLDFYGQLFNIPGRARRARAMDLLEMTGLAAHAHTKVSKFSKGMLQRVGFAQALVNDPEIVLLDEPLSGLDPFGRRQIRDLILELRSSGKTVFFSSHILQDVEMICDRVGILLEGRLLRAETMEAVLAATLRWVEVAVDGLAAEVLRDLGMGGVEEEGGKTLIRIGPDRDLGETIEAVAAMGGRIVSVVPHRQTLEDYFMRNMGPAGAAGRHDRPVGVNGRMPHEESKEVTVSGVRPRNKTKGKVGIGT